jgi:hypothetical protein
MDKIALICDTVALGNMAGAHGIIVFYKGVNSYHPFEPNGRP